MRIYESFEDVSEFMSRERVVSPLLDEQTSDYAQGLRMSGMSMTPWVHVQGKSGALRAWWRMEYERDETFERFQNLRVHELRATPVRMKNGETAYWVDVYVCAFKSAKDEEHSAGPIDTRSGLALHPRNFHTLSKEYYWPRRYWLAWAWVFSDPMTWYANITYNRANQSFFRDERYRRENMAPGEEERALFIWGGYAGQGYDVKVERYFQDDVKLQGSSSRVPLGGGVELEVYAHPDVIPTLSINSSLTSARETEHVLGALRRGKKILSELERG